MNLSAHPCFNDKARHTFGRIHLPVAPRCNVQCKFCNRKFDCVNESRPGVTSGILSPYQALVYLDEVIKVKPNIAVVGIAGPGDPFANPEETLETLRQVRTKYPEMLLCVASNGLDIGPHLDELARLKVSHVTITVNAVDPAIGAKIYSWVRYGKRVRRSDEGARLLLENQLKAIAGLKDRDITVKINSIIIPGINDQHIPEVAAKMAELKVDILNCVAYYPNQGAAFEDIPEPSKEMIQEVRGRAGKYLPQMHHCTRCRADAVGLLGETMNMNLINLLQNCEKLPEPPAVSGTPEVGTGPRPYVAVASMEGVLVNQHLGEAYQLLIYGREKDKISLVGTRQAPEPGGGMERWESLSHLIKDCHTLMGSGIGENPRRVLTTGGVNVLVLEGLIEDAVKGVFDGSNINYMLKRQTKACGAGCGGDGGGCD
ncbi:MAG: radical SAM protein [Deltaproteobacteria bacterium]|nr:radical SAM protein [Deltaproteobacteria bacterium]